MENALNTIDITQEGAAPVIDLGFIMPIITAGLIVTGILTALFILYFLISALRRRKVENATLEIQKDIRKIRELMEQGSQSPQAQSPPSSLYRQKETLARADTPSPAEATEITRIESESSRTS